MWQIAANGQGVSAVRCFSHLTLGTMKYALWHLSPVVCSWAAISNEYNKQTQYFLKAYSTLTVVL